MSSVSYILPISGSEENKSGNTHDEESTTNSPDSPIRIFNPGEHSDIPEKLVQSRQPMVGETISFFDSRVNRWTDATITANLSRKWNHYFNIVYNNGIEDGLYLLPDTRWTLKQTDQEMPRLHSDNPRSIEPTPQTTPDKSDSNIVQYDHSGLIPSFESLSLDSSNRPDNDLDLNLDLTSPDSLQWDDEGTDLLSSTSVMWPTDLHAVVNLDDILPIDLEHSSTPNNNSPHLNEAFSLAKNSPMASTPTQSRRVYPRRRTLPLETGRRQSFLQSFLRRLNPFKKKTG